ncbi:AKR1 [[Candida] subhashii]|uniref:protein S-acyltransferase n=1 Tax=[Candida] subhashii TaxID=561895 RepID=A0A8J5QFJ2_9ASCO|nr:AKR1 [[Candida] subhashii]KAG7660675.1 AKR1 [[Candida] subhashii]
MSNETNKRSIPNGILSQHIEDDSPIPTGYSIDDISTTNGSEKVSRQPEPPIKSTQSIAASKNILSDDLDNENTASGSLLDDFENEAENESKPIHSKEVEEPIVPLETIVRDKESEAPEAAVEEEEGTTSSIPAHATPNFDSITDDIMENEIEAIVEDKEEIKEDFQPADSVAEPETTRAALETPKDGHLASSNLEYVEFNLESIADNGIEKTEVDLSKEILEDNEEIEENSKLAYSGLVSETAKAASVPFVIGSPGATEEAFSPYEINGSEQPATTSNSEDQENNDTVRSLIDVPLHEEDVDERLVGDISVNEEIGIEETPEFETASIKSTDAIIETNTNKAETDFDGKTAEQLELESNPTLAKFMSACQDGNLTIVKELINSQQVNPNDSFNDGITGLHWACINNRLTLVRFLVENGADPNQLGGELKASPLHWACRNGLVYIVDYLITSSEADPSIRDSQSYNSLHLAVHSSNITLVIYLLLSCCDANSKKKLYVDEPDSFHRTCLHWAAYQGDIYTVNALLRFGADVSKVDNTLFIPIHWAFMKGYKTVLKALLEAGSNIHSKNDQNKDTFDIAKDMGCTNTWIRVLKECGRDPNNNWAPKKRWISPKVGKLMTFLAPYVLLPVSLNIISAYQGFGIPKIFLAIGLFAGGILAVNKVIIPTYLIDDKALAKSPLLAGVFSATAFWAIVVWLTAMFPVTFFKEFLTNVILGFFIGVFTWTFFKSMFINPGFVPTPSDNSVILAQVTDLVKLGKFDTDHFCVNSFVRKPLRSRYSRYNKKLIARFDHYCPWVYNDIGVRNHKLFMAFIYSLNLAILAFVHLSYRYFDRLQDAYDSDDDEYGLCGLFGDELCYGYKNHHFHFNLIIWCLFQYIWVTVLCIVQTFQILKGLTTWEFSTLNNKIQSSRFNHSTVPMDFGDSTLEPIPNQPTATAHRHDEFKTCLNLLGIDQFWMTIKLSIMSLFSKRGASSYESLNTVDIPTDYGIKQNWLDFWVIGEEKLRNVFYLPIEGENNLNGEVVDYYKLYEYPSKAAAAVV